MKEELISFLNNIIKYINIKILWAIFLSSILLTFLCLLNINFINYNLINFETVNQSVKSLIFIVAISSGAYFIVDFMHKELEKNYYRTFDKKMEESNFKEFLSHKESEGELKFLKILFENNLKDFFINDDFRELFIDESSQIFADGRAGLNQYVDDNIYRLKNRGYLKSTYKDCKPIYILTNFCWNKLKIMKKQGII